MEALCAFLRVRAHALALCGIVFLFTRLSMAQEGQNGTKPISQVPSRTPVAPVNLKDLIREAAQNNPEIAAAERGYRASTHTSAQVSALPDTQLMVQHFSVGSPRPFAGYTNSDFAYIGIGASQEIPYPGKRSLRAQVANGEAAVRRAETESVRRSVVDKLKAAISGSHTCRTHFPRLNVTTSC